MIDPIRAEEVSVPVFITQEARQLAQQFAQQHPDKTKAQQVSLNTLAVCAINNYLKILGIPADPSNSDSWNPMMRMLMNVADLDIVGRGRIECRPVSPAEYADSICYVPTDVQGDRIAYVVIEIDPNQPQALILGFVEQVDDELLPLNQLRPIAELPAYLDQYNPDHVTQFSHWIKGQIEAGWKTLDDLINVPQLSYRSTRSPLPFSEEESMPSLSRIVRGKVLDLPTEQGSQSIVLIAELSPKSDADIGVEMKVVPPNGQPFLPIGLTMTILDEVGDSVMHAEARDENRAIELGFRAEPGDRFSLKLELGKTIIHQSFIA